jgi:D-3-phosphoglycerate dehydrogenase
MPPFRVVITDATDPDNDLEAEVFRASGLDIDLRRSNTTEPRRLVEQVAAADAIIVLFATIDRSVIESLARCRVISRYGIGVDMIDIQAATEFGIPVAIVTDFCIDEVSTQTIGFVIDLGRHTFTLHEHVRAGKWGIAAPSCGAPFRLKGQTLGVVGLGNLGRAVASKAVCLGMRVLAADPYLRPGQASEVGAELVGLDELLRRSDFVSLHCPLVPETRGLIGAAQLASMKPTAYLINMARGAVVDQESLHRALVEGTIAGAALDVLEREPPQPDDPLLRLDNVIITPHTASWSLEAYAHLRRSAAQNVVDVLQGRLPPSVVNRRALGL